MTKIELATEVAKSAGVTKTVAENVIKKVTETITRVLANGDKVQLMGFGTFEVKERAARKGRNPQTGEEIDIPAAKVPSFKAGKLFKDTINA